MSPRTRWSPPEQKASGPSPVRMITPTSPSSRARSNASESSIDRLRPEGVAHLGPVDRDLRDPVAAESRSGCRRTRRAGGPGHGHGAAGYFPSHGGRVLAGARGARAPRHRPPVNDGSTYARAARAARAPRRAGLPRGARVGIALPPGEDFVVALHACLLRGARRRPARPAARPTPSARRSTCVRRRRRSTARCAGAASDAAPSTTSTRRRSSSTPRARPARRKPVAPDLRQLAVERAGQRGRARRRRRDERWLCALPLSHVGGLSILLRSAIYGTTAIVHERFDTERVAARAARRRTARRSSRSSRRRSRGCSTPGCARPPRCAGRCSAARRCRRRCWRARPTPASRSRRPTA